MSGSFTGFSEDYIRKLGSVSKDDTTTKVKSTGIHGNDGISSKRQDHRNGPKRISIEEKRHIVLNEKIEKLKSEPITEDAKLKVNSENTLSTLVAAPDDSVSQEAGEPPNQLPQDQVLPNIKNKLNLEEAAARQKLIEEQNRQRKEVLSRALADKTKKTLAESQKLKQIQVELHKLDSLQSSDINILRKQIELASFDYMEAEKRYFRLEREYLDSKLDLHLKLERKELLAEHLCTIIENNEEKKAIKLNDMLAQLNLNAISEENKQDNTNSGKC